MQMGLTWHFSAETRICSNPGGCGMKMGVVAENAVSGLGSDSVGSGLAGIDSPGMLCPPSDWGGGGGGGCDVSISGDILTPFSPIDDSMLPVDEGSPLFLGLRGPRSCCTAANTHSPQLVISIESQLNRFTSFPPKISF